MLQRWSMGGSSIRDDTWLFGSMQVPKLSPPSASQESGDGPRMW